MAKKKYDKIERINQSQYPLIGSNIRRLRKEQNLKAVDIIAKLQLQGILITTGTSVSYTHLRAHETGT